MGRVLLDVLSLDLWTTDGGFVETRRQNPHTKYQKEFLKKWVAFWDNVWSMYWYLLVSIKIRKGFLTFQK